MIGLKRKVKLDKIIGQIVKIKSVTTLKKNTEVVVVVVWWNKVNEIQVSMVQIVNVKKNIVDCLMFVRQSLWLLWRKAHRPLKLRCSKSKSASLWVEIRNRNVGHEKKRIWCLLRFLKNRSHTNGTYQAV